MDRPFSYIGQLIAEWMFSRPAQDAMLALGKALQATAGTATFTVGLACTPNSPAALNVLVGEGEIYMMEALEASVMGTLPADTSHQVQKQGMLRSTSTLSCPAPGTGGQSINYLVQATYQDQDVSLDPTTGLGNVVLPFFSGTVGGTPYSGPNNTGQTSNTFRKGVCVVSVKAGAAATTGSQTTPAPDSGYVGLYVVTVANGQSTITSGNISAYSGAPAALPTLSQIPAAEQNRQWSYAADTGTANTYAAAMTPAVAAYVAGQEFIFKAGNTNTGASTLNVNGLGAKSIVRRNGTALQAADIIAGQMVTVRYDGTNFQITGARTATSSLGSSGWKIDDDGFIEQWGVTSAITSGSSVAVTFPINFTTAEYGAWATPNTNSIATANAATCGSLATGGMTVYFVGGTPAGCFWRVIGK